MGMWPKQSRPDHPGTGIPARVAMGVAVWG
jgi:hypothetical protein